MDILSQLLSSKARTEIFRLLFSGQGVELYGRDIERKAGLSHQNVQQELKKLQLIDLVNARKSGNRVYYKANSDHPIYPDIKAIVFKTIGLVDVLRTALRDKKICMAFIFGSVAEGTEKGASDIDLMVVGSVGLRDVAGMLTGAHDKVNREINPHVLSEDEFKKRLAAGERFLKTVVGSKKIFIKGTENDLAAMGG